MSKNNIVEKCPLNEEVEIEVLYVAPLWHEKTQVLKGGGKNVKRGGGEVWEKFFDKLSSLSLIPINSLLQLMSQFFCLHLSHTNTHLHFLRFFSYIISKNLFPLICQLESCFFITSVVLLLCLNYFLSWFTFSIYRFFLHLFLSNIFSHLFSVPNNNKKVLTKKMYFLPHPSFSLINLSDIFFSSRKLVTSSFK